MEDLVRREVERCDRLAGVFAMMSVAGGTGSGVGTYVTQCLRDAYPHSFILNHLTWPYGTGEVNSIRFVNPLPFNCFFLSGLVSLPAAGYRAKLQFGSQPVPSLHAVRRPRGARERHGAQNLQPADEHQAHLYL